MLKNIIDDKETCDSKIKNILKLFKKNLYNIDKKIKENNLCSNYYETNSDDIKINKKIRNVFYKLILDLSNFIYIYEKKNEDSLKPKNVLINNVDDLFYERTLSSHFYNLVKSYYNRNVDINS